MPLTGFFVSLAACGSSSPVPTYAVPTPTIDIHLANASPLEIDCTRYVRVYVGDRTYSTTVYAGRMDNDGPRVEIRTLGVDLHALVFDDTGLIGEMLVFDGLYYARKPDAAWVQMDSIPMRDYELFPEGHNSSCPALRYLQEIGYGIVDTVLAGDSESELREWPMLFEGSDDSTVIPNPVGGQPRSLSQGGKRDD